MTTPTDAELLPCPFCGSKEVNVADDLITFYGECSSCWATAAYSSYRAGAVQAWNRRAPQAVAGGETVTKERYSEPLARVINAGYALSNCAFNLAQRPGTEISLGTAQTLSECRKEWDAACAAHKALPPAPPPQAVREPQPMPDLTRLTERGATAWAGVDAQALRMGGITKGGQHGADT